jgi:hypothetical protein
MKKCSPTKPTSADILVGGTKFVISESIGVIYFYIIGGNTFRYSKAFQKCIFQTQVDA